MKQKLLQCSSCKKEFGITEVEFKFEDYYCKSCLNKKREDFSRNLDSVMRRED